MAQEVNKQSAKLKRTAFVTGDGANRPRGFLDYPEVDNDTWSWGNIGAVATGVAGGFDPASPADALIDLVFSLKAEYRANATFVMSRLTQSEVRKLKDADGNYLWQPSLGPDRTPALLGFPLAECEDLPDIAPNSLSIAF